MAGVDSLVRCVLFDLYGTLVDVSLDEDTAALWEGLRAAMVRSGGTAGSAGDVRRRFHAILRDEATRAGEGFLLEPTFRRLLASAGARDDVASLGRVFRALSTVNLSVRPYVPPLFEQLRATGCAYGIVSNTEAVLTRFDLDQRPILLTADTIVLSSDVGVRKPDPAIFAIALEGLHVAPGDSVFVGNSLAEDIEGARRAGLRAIFLGPAILDPDAPGVASAAAWAGSVVRAAPAFGTLSKALQRFGWQPAVTAGSPEMSRR